MSGNHTMDETSRLEAALERIARASMERRLDRAMGTVPDKVVATLPVGLTEADMVAKLDRLIAELRDALGTTP